MQFRLRTLLIVLAVGPMVLAWGYRNAPDQLAFWREPKPVTVLWEPAVMVSGSVCDFSEADQ